MSRVAVPRVVCVVAGLGCGHGPRFLRTIPASASAATGKQCTSDAFAPSLSNSPTQQKVASIALGKVNARFAMTVKIILIEFVLPTAVAIGLGFLLSIGANYLTERYLGAVIDLLT